MRRHFVSKDVIVLPFNLTTAVMFVILAFIIWYGAGYVFARIWNWAGKQKH